MIPLDDIQRASRALGERGLDAAGRGDLHEARRLLLESTQLSDDDPRYLKALGYCAFAVGDVSAAYHAWRKAELLLGGRGSLPWVRSLEHGILRVTVDRYNSAITLARQGKHREAVNMLDRVLEEVPDFVPAGKAKGMCQLALEDRVGAHTTWTKQQELCRDDPDFERLLTGLAFREKRTDREPLVAGAVVAPALATPFREPRPSSGGPVYSATPHEVPALRTRTFPWRSIGVISVVLILSAIALWPRGQSTMTARADSTLAVVNPAPVTQAVVIPPAESAARAKAPPPSQRASFTSRYRQGEAAVKSGQWPRAISYLGPIAEFGSREPYHDHVLAMLVQSYQSTGRTADARRTAWMLVQKYPDSQYITDELRQIAGVGEKHEK